MSLLEPADSQWRDRLLSILRIVVAAPFLEHGTQKMFNVPPSAHPMDYHFASLMGVAGVLETFGGLLLLIGLLTRPVAFLLAGEMAVAYFKAHFPRGFFPINSGGEPAVLFCFIFLYISVAGAGVWSVDHVLARSRRAGTGAGAATRPRHAEARPQTG